MGVPIESIRSYQPSYSQSDLPPTPTELTLSTQLAPIPVFYPAGFCPLCIGQFVDTRNRLRYCRLFLEHLLGSREGNTWTLSQVELPNRRGTRHIPYQLEFDRVEDPHHVIRVTVQANSRSEPVEVHLPHCLHPRRHRKLDD